MYQVIARKYRPQGFDDVVGQEHVKTTLRNAIAQNRIAHGYIFSGQRGTGKTTMARIIARCLNCEQGPTAEPCGVCASCLEVAAGGSVDVIEIDAASNRGINEMRELRENVRYRPVRDRYKVFIVDEAHQITSEAFNALLKTLEEPPAWALFILCTTESHKIPATIASRCQHFSFRSVDYEELIARMAWICTQEGIAADTETLGVIAHAGEGSVRDSLSALDQAIACCGNTLDAAAVRALLGAYSIDSLARIAQALLDQSSAPMLALVGDLERNGENLQHFSRELSRFFRNLLVARIAGSDTQLLAASPREREQMAQIAARFSEPELTRYLQLSLDLFRDLQYSLQPRFHLELGLVKLVMAGRLIDIEKALAGLPPAPAKPAFARAPAPSMAPSTTPPPRPAPAARPAGPSPFELDRLKKGGRPEPQSMGANALAPAPVTPLNSGEPWSQRLHDALIELGLPFTADAMAHSEVEAVGNELRILAPKEFQLSLTQDDLQKALQHAGAAQLRAKISFGAPTVPAARMETKRPAVADDAERRALENAEVARFRELFGGELRNIKNLKE
ncbi:MAG TPA: DNA polymerase III subunit gamma/tau [Solibacterales bacterium]|nr:DNA polymerase III subunit gamma/tau [Bryobacterales bacterium]